MVFINGVARVILMGNTYANREKIKALGAVFDNGSKTWSVNIERHPMNNVKQRKKLEAKLTELEENGVEIVKYLCDGAIK